MLDRDGYRPNVGIILANQRNDVFWAKRVNQHAWQFPQGGIKQGETPVQAMYRELEEEIGLQCEHVELVRPGAPDRAGVGGNRAEVQPSRVKMRVYVSCMLRYSRSRSAASAWKE